MKNGYCEIFVFEALLYCKKKVTTSASSFDSLNGTLILGCDSSYNETKVVSKER